MTTETHPDATSTLMPGARMLVDKYLRIQKGETVILFCDQILEEFATAIEALVKEREAQIQRFYVEDLLPNLMFGRNLPEAHRSALEEADAAIYLGTNDGDIKRASLLFDITNIVMICNLRYANMSNVTIEAISRVAELDFELVDALQLKTIRSDNMSGFRLMKKGLLGGNLEVVEPHI